MDSARLTLTRWALVEKHSQRQRWKSAHVLSAQQGRIPPLRILITLGESASPVTIFGRQFSSIARSAGLSSMRPWRTLGLASYSTRASKLQLAAETVGFRLSRATICSRTVSLWAWRSRWLHRRAGGWPEPASRPTAAEHQSVAAVFKPVTCKLSLKMMPSPRKPILDTTWAATRVALAFPGIRLAKTTKLAAPIATACWCGDQPFADGVGARSQYQPRAVLQPPD